jgi:hypothetical protein
MPLPMAPEEMASKVLPPPIIDIAFRIEAE